jgi:anti-sigma factor RsiW
VSRCLGTRIADLADGRLTPAETERAFAHVAVCSACHDALVAQRAVISRLDTVGPIDPSSDLLARLSGIAAPGTASAIPVQGGAGARPGGAAGRRPAGSPAGSTRPPARRTRGRLVLAGAAGAAALAVAVVVGGSSALTGAVVPRQAIAPVVDTLTDEHVVSVEQMPFSGPRIVTVGYTDPFAATDAQPSQQP